MNVRMLTWALSELDPETSVFIECDEDTVMAARGVTNIDRLELYPCKGFSVSTESLTESAVIITVNKVRKARKSQ